MEVVNDNVSWKGLTRDSENTRHVKKKEENEKKEEGKTKKMSRENFLFTKLLFFRFRLRLFFLLVEIHDQWLVKIRVACAEKKKKSNLSTLYFARGQPRLIRAQMCCWRKKRKSARISFLCSGCDKNNNLKPTRRYKAEIPPIVSSENNQAVWNLRNCSNPLYRVRLTARYFVRSCCSRCRLCEVVSAQAEYVCNKFFANILQYPHMRRNLEITVNM